MGFFNDLNNFAGDMLRNNYRKMPIEQLKQEWNSVFGKRLKSNGLGYNDFDAQAILDEVYGERVTRKNWRFTIREYEEEKQRKEREKQRKEEERKALETAKKAEDKRIQQRNSEFANTLDTNKMIQEILSKLNEMAFEADCIFVSDDRVDCYGDDMADESHVVFLYRHYGYPKLERWQIGILLKYLHDHLKLNYDLEDNTEHDSYDSCLQLNDSPNGMRDSW